VVVGVGRLRVAHERAAGVRVVAGVEHERALGEELVQEGRAGQAGRGAPREPVARLVGGRDREEHRRPRGGEALEPVEHRAGGEHGRGGGRGDDERAVARLGAPQALLRARRGRGVVERDDGAARGGGRRRAPRGAARRRRARGVCVS
jgi:hypothetical protein